MARATPTVAFKRDSAALIKGLGKHAVGDVSHKKNLRRRC
jgi:hypothetical protein